MDTKTIATEAFDGVESELQDISKWLYDNPELAYQEHQSAGRLSEFLGDHGFDVTFPAYGLDTAFEATVGTSGPRVVICAEYDALPEVGHACGHNIIATSSVGAGVAVAGLVDKLGIRVTVLGTPAEEGGGGKIDLLDAGAFDDAAASMLIHPSPRNIANPLTLAARGVTVRYNGKEAHAAAAPHAGINALDAFVQAYNGISAMRQQFQPGDRVHGVIDEGGVAPNITPALTSSRWIIRAETAARFEELQSKVMACFEAAAVATGCTLDFEFEGEAYMDLISEPKLAELFSANCEALGRNMPVEFEPAMASTDMGNVSHVVPSIHPSVAIETTSVNHQPEFAASTVTPSGNRALRDGALGMAHTIIDLAEQGLWDELTDPSIG